MLKLDAIKSEKIWGYELWIASTHPNGCQDNFKDFCGGDYPLLIKVIQANDTLSIQVHPDDEDAVRLEGPGNRGKTECWYVLDAAPGAKLVYGLKDGASREQLADAIQNNALDPYLNFVEVKNSKIKSNTNVSHLSYIGDSELGSHVNIGAGTITANYNPITKVKSKTIIKDGANTGSNSVLVAPVEMGENSMLAAGSIATKDIEANALSLTRSPQTDIENWVK